MKYLLSFGLFISICWSCSLEKKEKFSTHTSETLHYATGFSYTENPKYTVVDIRNPRDTGYVLARYILVDRRKPLPDSLPEGQVIQIPVKSAVAFGTIPCGALSELNVLQTLKGATDIEYIRIDSVTQKIKTGEIQSVGNSYMPDLEKLIMLQPEIIFTAPLDQSLQNKLTELGLNTIICTEFTESSPLGRAEWLKLYGLFTGTRTTADSLFRRTEQNYLKAKRRVDSVSRRPSLLVEKKYGQVWYIPSENSYAANLYRDAGANYTCQAHGSNPEKSIPLSFEQVWTRYADADIWLFKYFDSERPLLSLSDLQKENETYAKFKPFKTQQIYACNSAFAPYYEQATFRPDLILYDLIAIFHPEILPDYQLQFFHKLISESCVSHSID